MPDEQVDDNTEPPRYSAKDLDYVRRMLSLDPGKDAAEMMQIRSEYLGDRWENQYSAQPNPDKKS